MSFYQLSSVAINVTAPLLIILLIGIFFKKINFIDNNFVAVANKLVFKVALPCLLFLSMANRPLHEDLPVMLISYAILATIISIAIVWFMTIFIVEKSQQGVFTQCAFRGNMGIIGIALCINAYGNDVLAQVSVYVAVLTILYNVLSVLLLSTSHHGIIKNIIKNPLIIGIVLGYLWSYLSVPLPDFMATSINYLAKLTLPLALLCIGASLNWKSLQANHKAALWCTALKLAVLPFWVCLGAVLIGIQGQALGILFLMISAPTAAAAYVMSEQMTKHGQLAAEIITLSTLISPFSITLGLMILKYLQLI